MNIKSFRRGQAKAYALLLERIQAREPFTTIVLPTRYGKSDVIRCVAISGTHERIGSCFLALSPNATLRRQMVLKSKLEDMAHRYGIDASLLRLMREVINPFGDIEVNESTRPNANHEILLSATVQLIHRNRDFYTKWIASEAHTTGAPVVVFVDEAHFVGGAKRWGETVNALANAGALLVLMTATAVRADGDIIPGFDVEALDERDHKRWIVEDAGDGLHNRVTELEGSQELVRLRAHLEVTFAEAWNEQPSPLCTLTRDVIDCDMAELGGDGEEAKLSELKPSVVRGVLGRAIRNPTVVRAGVEKMLSELRRYRRIRPDCAAIVFTGNDEESDAAANRHAKAVREAIEELAPKYELGSECIIATLKSEDSDKPDKRILDFCDGAGDFLIVKQMAGAGIDSPRLKVLLDLSSVRTFAAVMQRIMRVATPTGNINVASVITLADCLMAEIWQRGVTNHGGEWRDRDMNPVDTYLVEKSDGEPPTVWTVDGAGVAAYDDNFGNNGDMDVYAKVEALIRKLPLVSGLYTKPQIAEFFQHGSGCPVDGIDDEIHWEQDRINAVAHAVAKHRTLRMGRYDRAAFSGHIRDVYVVGYRGAGVRPGVTLEQISSLDTLKTIRHELEQLAAMDGVDL